jgi:hypothetical protein
MYTLVKFKLQNKTIFTFQPSRVATKIYILTCAHFSFKINMSPIQTILAYAEDQLRPPPPRGAPHSLGTSVPDHLNSSRDFYFHLLPLCVLFFVMCKSFLPSRSSSVRVHQCETLGSLYMELYEVRVSVKDRL